MLPRRRFPGWKRIGLEYVAMTLVYVAVWVVTKNIILAVIALIGTMLVGRATRDKGEPPATTPTKDKWP